MEPSEARRGLDRWIIWVTVAILALLWTLIALDWSGLDLANSNSFVSSIFSICLIVILSLGLILVYLVAAYKRG